MATKNPTSLRLSDDALKLIKQLEKATGLKRAGIVELAIRDLASKYLTAAKEKAK